MKNVAIIGSAGRKSDGPRLNKAMWRVMLATARKAIASFDRPIHLISGGAAWADHLAVALYLEGTADELTLHLPAGLVDGRFIEDPRRGHMDPGRIANHYHRDFAAKAGVNGPAEIGLAIERGAQITIGTDFKQRNGMVARDATDGIIAYTFGGQMVVSRSVPGDAGHESATLAGLKDGGTADTWVKADIAKVKIHIPLDMLEAAIEQARVRQLANKEGLEP